jgi:filamentous hemagglutinin family protein
MKVDPQVLKCVIVAWALLIPRGAIAQVSADGTLETQVRQGDGLQWVVDGGSQVGGNLFHSFQTFSIPLGGEVWFDSPAAVTRILGRVTGGTVSRLEGMLRANGTADVFLLNPAGILIGPEARLAIGGAFVGTTATAVQFADGSWFGTGAIATGVPPLLTQSAPVGLQFGATVGAIEMIGPRTGPGISAEQGLGSDLGAVPAQRLDADALAAAIATEQQFLDNPAGLRVAPGQTIALVGGAVAISGGLLKAPSGQVVLASVDPGTELTLTPTYQIGDPIGDLPLGDRVGDPPLGDRVDDSITNRPHFSARGGQLSLADRTVISTSGDGRGHIQLRGGSVELGEQVQLRSTTLTAVSPVPPMTAANGGITVWADRLTLAPGSQLVAGTLSAGAGGRLSLEAGAIAAHHSQLSANTFSTGAAGDLSLRATGSLDLVGTGVSSRVFGAGDGGAVMLAGESVSLRQGAQVDVSTSGAGNAGAIQVQARDRLILTGAGLDGQRSGIFSTVDNLFATGAAGEISLRARQIHIREGARVDSGTVAVGDAGSVRLRAEDGVWIDGGTEPWRSPPSGVASGVLPTATGDAGDVQIHARTIAITGGAQVESPTAGSGQGGRVELVASDWIHVEGTAANPRDSRSAVLTSSLESLLGPGGGAAGDVLVRSPWIRVRHGAVIDSSTFDRGNAGSVTVWADRLDLQAGRIRTTAEGDVPADAGNLTLRAGRIELTEGAEILADTNGRGGNVAIAAQTLVLRDRSRITANAAGLFPGGNLTLDLGTLTALNNSDLTANALNSNGGQVSITAQGIFGPTRRDQLTPASDITATSALGPQFSGTVQLNTPALDPTRGLLALPATPVDAAQLIRQALCRQISGSQFHRRGRGGLPNQLTRWGETEMTVVRAIAPVALPILQANPSPSASAHSASLSQPTYFLDSAAERQVIEPTTWIHTATGQIQLIHQGDQGQDLFSTTGEVLNCN